MQPSDKNTKTLKKWVFCLHWANIEKSTRRSLILGRPVVSKWSYGYRLQKLQIQEKKSICWVWTVNNITTFITYLFQCQSVLHSSFFKVLCSKRILKYFKGCVLTSDCFICSVTNNKRFFISSSPYQSLKLSFRRSLGFSLIFPVWVQANFWVT